MCLLAASDLWWPLTLCANGDEKYGGYEMLSRGLFSCPDERAFNTACKHTRTHLMQCAQWEPMSSITRQIQPNFFRSHVSTAMFTMHRPAVAVLYVFVSVRGCMMSTMRRLQCMRRKEGLNCIAHIATHRSVIMSSTAPNCDSVYVRGANKQGQGPSKRSSQYRVSTTLSTHRSQCAV